jgi:hypothetical protein
MDGAHPSELDLLAYVEEELPDARKIAVSEHVAACAACGDAVRALETGRHALRSAPALELTPDRRAAIMSGLPARRARSGWSWRPRLVAPALAAAAAAAVLVGIVVTVDPGSGDEQAAMVEERADDAAGQEAAPESSATTALTAPEDRPLASGVVRTVQGPPREVAALLRRNGFRARVVDSRVEVRDADPDAVMRTLAGRSDGPVPVFVP